MTRNSGGWQGQAPDGTGTAEGDIPESEAVLVPAASVAVP